MNETHGVAAGAGAVLVSPLTGVLTAWKIPDPSDTAVLIVAALCGLYALVAWFVRWRWPSVPPLPEAVMREPPRAP